MAGIQHRMRMRVRSAAALAAAAAPLTTLVTLLALGGCGPAGGAVEVPPAHEPEAPPRIEPTPPPQAVPDPLAGLWWIFSPRVPNRAFRVSLEPADEDEPHAGTWVAFDWRASPDSETLAERSKPVRIEARLDDGRLIVSGSMPMLMENGQPNGHSGKWRIELRRIELPGESLRWAGTAVHDEGLTGPEGLAVEMEHSFRPYR